MDDARGCSLASTQQDTLPGIQQGSDLLEALLSALRSILLSNSDGRGKKMSEALLVSLVTHAVCYWAGYYMRYRFELRKQKKEEK